jgi:murein DD-endopeptidase MepM/ murein hydrolase activator NlpD
MRRHPISGYTKMHKGIDFAAPRGTPIRAAGDGVISFAGTKGGYGRYISIRHNSDYTTAYAHMHRLAKGMRKGQRVKQGQVIGYVGSTGRSTGPHLHYEVLLKGKHVNPTQLRLPSGKSLTGPELARFKQQVAAVDALRKGRASDTLLAARPE